MCSNHTMYKDISIVKITYTYMATIFAVVVVSVTVVANVVCVRKYHVYTYTHIQYTSNWFKKGTLAGEYQNGVEYIHIEKKVT